LPYNFDNTSAILDKFWKPNGTTFDKTNENKIQSCMNQNQITESIPALINGGTIEDRNRVIACLGLKPS
jgi:hypothetical protein